MAALLAAGCLAAGCAAAGPGRAASTTSSPAAASTPVFATSGTVTVAVPSLPTNFNPLAPGGANRITTEVMAAVWPHAFVTSSSFEQIADPGFVESAEVYGLSPFTVVYQLNPKAVWSDGVPITARDFVFDWHEMLSYAGELPDSGIVAGYRAISSIASSDHGHTVTVTFREPFAEWESLFSTLVPAHIARAYGWISAFSGFNPSLVISGGPFEISTFVPRVRLVLTRNPRYWYTPAGLSKIVLVVRSPAEAASDLVDGSVDLAELSPGPSAALAPSREAASGAGSASAVAAPDEAASAGSASAGVPAVGLAGASTGVLAGASIIDDEAAAAAHGIGLESSISLLPQLWQLCFNMTNPVVASPYLRQAIGASIERGQVVSASVGLGDWTQNANPSRLAMLGGPGAPTPAVDEYNASLAEQLFGQAGYKLDGEGRLEAASSTVGTTPSGTGLGRRGDPSSGPAGGSLPATASATPRLTGASRTLTLTLVVPEGDPYVAAAASQVAAQLRDVGVAVVTRSVPLSLLLGKVLPEGHYELALAPFLLTNYAAGIAAVYSTSVLPRSFGSPASSEGASDGGATVKPPQLLPTTTTTSVPPSSSSTSTTSGSGPLTQESSSTTTTAPPSATTSTTVPPTSTTTTTTLLVRAGQVENPALPWGVPTPIGTEPGAVNAGVVTRDVFGLGDPLVSSLFGEAMTGLDLGQSSTDLDKADAQLWADVPTVPLFQEPVALVRQTALVGVSESPTWAGPFWDVQKWALQISPAPTIPAFPGVTPVSPISSGRESARFLRSARPASFGRLDTGL